MKIVIDISSVIYGTGVSVYTENLIQRLLEIDRDNNYVLFGGSLRRFKELSARSKAIISKSNTSTISKIFPVAPSMGNFIWNKLHTLPIEKLLGRVDVYHSSDWTQPPTKAFKVTTVHDLSPVLLPELTHPKIVSTHKDRLKWVLRECDRVIVPSETTASDMARLGFDKTKIRVIGEAVEPGLKQVEKEDIERVKKKYRITGDYLLSVGVNARKNTKRIIEAYEKVKPGNNLKLVIIGYAHKRIEPSKGVVFTGYLPQSDKPGLFSGASALVYPSLYEGFGLPILEAYTCHTPVVTSNLGSMKELGGAAVLVNPEDTESIANGIVKAIADKRKLTAIGKKEVKKYSWKKVAQDTLAVYRESST